jgi:hypothetical protein
MGKVDLEALGMVGSMLDMEEKVIKFYSKVKELSSRSKLVRSYKIGDDVECEMQDMGWYMLLEGSWEALYVGTTQPEGLTVGDEVEVVIRRKI